MNPYEFELTGYICPLCNQNIAYRESYHILEACHHVFHTLCLKRFFINNHFICPICNVRLSADDESEFRRILNQRPLVIGNLRDPQVDGDDEDSGYESLEDDE